jgi:uncharacterized protein YfaS (alpha-2-macroglobulin family)
MSCGNQQLAKQFTLSVDQPKAKYKLGDTIKIHLKTKKAVEFQSITYHFQNKTYETTSKNADLEIPTDQLLLGKYQLKAKIQVGEESVEIDKWVKITIIKNLSYIPLRSSILILIISPAIPRD